MITALPAVAGTDLPRLAYVHQPDHDPMLTLPQHFRPIEPGGYVKPFAGGLWTAPVTATASSGAPLETAWTEWCRDNMWGAGEVARFIDVLPNPEARVLRIDTLADLVAVASAFPAAPLYLADEMLRPDWFAMAKVWDAVWLTDAGQWATRLTEPNLYTWDCETVLWLRPAYSCPALAAAPATEDGAL